MCCSAHPLSSIPHKLPALPREGIRRRRWESGNSRRHRESGQQTCRRRRRRPQGPQSLLASNDLNPRAASRDRERGREQPTKKRRGRRRRGRSTCRKRPARGRRPGSKLNSHHGLFQSHLAAPYPRRSQGQRVDVSDSRTPRVRRCLPRCRAQRCSTALLLRAV